MIWSKYVFLTFLILSTLSWTSCQKHKTPSVLIIAVDHLSSENSICSPNNDDNKESGLAVLCQEAIRYTHSYTTSTQPAAAMASLLTGQYPFEHHLHRSFDRISSESVLLSQLAKRQNYRTSFFSGSPNILKKTGLSLYFDLFDDSVAVPNSKYYVDLPAQAEAFFNWHSDKSEPFLSVVYNSQVNFMDESNTESPADFYRDLYLFFEELKKNNLWQNNYIIVVGLNGHNTFSRYDMTRFTNLHGENTKITTFIKPPRHKGDEGIHWKSDSPINLADIGKTLMCIFNLCHVENDNENSLLFPTFNLFDHWHKNIDLNHKLQSRVLAIESPSTWTIKNFSWSLVYNEYLWIVDNTSIEQAKSLYNTLNDKNETIDILRQDGPNEAIVAKQLEYLNSLNLNFVTPDQKSMFFDLIAENKNKLKKTNNPIEVVNLALENMWGLY